MNKYSWEQIKKDFEPLVNDITKNIVKIINNKAKTVKTELKRPKEKFLLEELITRLESLV